jgi:hypothetical protein
MAADAKIAPGKNGLADGNVISEITGDLAVSRRSIFSPLHRSSWASGLLGLSPTTPPRIIEGVLVRIAVAFIAVAFTGVYALAWR